MKSSCVAILRAGRKTANLTLQVSRAAIIRVVLQLLHSSSNISILPLLLGVVANLLNVVAVIVVEPDTNVWFSSKHRGGAIWYWRGRSCVKQATNLTKKWNDIPLPHLVFSVVNILNLTVLRRLLYWKVLTWPNGGSDRALCVVERCDQTWVVIITMYHRHNYHHCHHHHQTLHGHQKNHFGSQGCLVKFIFGHYGRVLSKHLKG